MERKKLLIADDSEMNRAILANILDQDYEIIEAADGREAIAALQVYHGEISALLLDIIMPEMDGYAACRLLSNESGTKDIPIVFVTSKNQKADRLWAQMQGGKAFVTKPYAADAIVDQMKAFL